MDQVIRKALALVKARSKKGRPTIEDLHRARRVMPTIIADSNMVGLSSMQGPCAKLLELVTMSRRDRVTRVI